MESAKLRDVERCRISKNLLMQFYRLLKGQNARGPSSSEFFPLKVEDLVRYVLKWEIEGVAEIGTVGICERVRGRCDYMNHKILIAVDANSNAGERAFTVAHEIGHAVLHGHSRQSADELNRTRSVRRRVSHKPGNDTPPRLEREANKFAVELLMPERAVRERFHRVFGRESLRTGSQILRSRGHSQTIPDIVETSRQASRLGPLNITEQDKRNLVEFFGVSVEAMALRLRELGLIYSGGIISM